MTRREGEKREGEETRPATPDRCPAIRPLVDPQMILTLQAEHGWKGLPLTLAPEHGRAIMGVLRV